MCIFNYVKCSCCFQSVDRYSVSLCGQQLNMTSTCQLTRQHFYDTNYYCGWCILMKCHTRNYCISPAPVKKIFFNTLHQLHSNPGFEFKVYRKLQNLVYTPYVPENYTTLCAAPTTNSFGPFSFSLFDP